jgi:hypothetical protein
LLRVVFAGSLLCSLHERRFAEDICVSAPCISSCHVQFLVSNLVSGHHVRAFDFAAAGLSCSSLCAELSTMGKPYLETEELLDYEEEEEATRNAVAAKTNGETIKKCLREPSLLCLLRMCKNCRFFCFNDFHMFLREMGCVICS